MRHRPSLGTEQVTVLFAASPVAWGLRAVLLGTASLILGLAGGAAMAERLRAVRGPLAEAALSERLAPPPGAEGPSR